MKFIISLVIVYCSLLLASISGAEYYPEPNMIPAVTKPALEGKYWKLWVPPYGAPYWICYTDQEVADYIKDNEGAQSDLNEELGPCKKCESLEWELWPYNGEEVCIYYEPCPTNYLFINYNGVDGCFKCPDNYQFNDDDVCQWAGSGPQPTTPPPTIPTGFEASDGTSSKNVRISWNQSDNTDFYYLQRAGVPHSDEPFHELARVKNIVGPFGKIIYYDTTTDYWKPYMYRVKACHEGTGQCSDYTAIDKGFKVGFAPGTLDLLLGKKPPGLD